LRPIRAFCAVRLPSKRRFEAYGAKLFCLGESADAIVIARAKTRAPRARCARDDAESSAADVAETCGLSALLRCAENCARERIEKRFNVA
jgi:hypothetical protein